MEIEGETKICLNCNKPILISHFDLHEIYCIRNIIKCPQCYKPIEKREVEQHIKEAHSKQICTYCQQEFEAIEIKQHQQNCQKQPQKCIYCQMPISYDNYSSHVYSCGSRTEKCQFCKKNIQLSELQDHEVACQISQEEKLLKLSDNSLESYDSFELKNKANSQKRQHNNKQEKAGIQSITQQQKYNFNNPEENKIDKSNNYKPFIKQKHTFYKKQSKQIQFDGDIKQNLPKKNTKFDVISYQEAQKGLNHSKNTFFQNKKFIEIDDDPIIASKPKHQQPKKHIDYDEIRLQNAIQASLQDKVSEDLPPADYDFDYDNDLQKAIELSQQKK